MLKIGKYSIKNPYILAPMAGVSQKPFRVLAIKMGAGLAPTELVSSKGLFFDSIRSKSYLAHDRSVEEPFCVQLFGGDAFSMAKGAEIAAKLGAQIIDINMGCPVKKVTKTNAGSALLCDIERAQTIVSAMISAVGNDVAITAKIRSGWDLENLNFLDVAKALEDVGICAIAIHARTRSQGYSGKADWDHIAKLKAHLSIPVIGNGDVKNFKDAQKMLTSTGCDAVMVGRAALGNPWIFKELTSQAVYNPSADERLSIVMEHMHGHLELNKMLSCDMGRAYNSEQAIKSFRSHLIWYSKGMSGGSLFRQKVMMEEREEGIFALISDFFSKSSTLVNEILEDDDGINYAQAFG